MVRRYLRTRSRKRVRVKTPGGKTVTHFKREKATKATCGRCRKRLSGTPNKTSSENRALKPSERTPSRPYAGVLCNECLDELVRYVTRFEVKHANPEYRGLDFQRDLTIEKFLPMGWYGQVSSGSIRKEKLRKTGEKKEKPAKQPKKEKKPAKKEKKAAKKKKAE